MKAATNLSEYAPEHEEISIHAAREGGDLRVVADKPKGLISIHAAREGGDHTPTFKRLIIFKFQSTPPVKAATNSILLKLHVAGISIHAAREGGDDSKSARMAALFISIHAAREGGDQLCIRIKHATTNFNPRRP